VHLDAVTDPSAAARRGVGFASSREREGPASAVDTLLVPLSGEGPQAIDALRRTLRVASVDVLRLNELADVRGGLLRRRYPQLAIAGSPPEREIGYGLTPAIALATRPERVLVVDLDRGRIKSLSLRRHLVGTLPFGCSQLLMSTIALGVQGLLGEALRLAPPRVQRRAQRPPQLRRVLYLRPAAGAASPVGGSVTHAHEVIRGLRAEGIEIAAFTPDRAIAATAASEAEPPCEWHVVEVSPTLNAVPASAAFGSDLALLRAALPAARASDIIYQRHGRFSLVGSLLSRLTGVPLFLEYNGSQEFVGRYWNPTPLKRRLAHCEEAALRTAARILVVSEVDRDNLLSRGIEPHRLVVNRNGVAIERFAGRGGAKLRRALGLQSEHYVIGFVGTFGPWHGAPVLARAFCETADALTQARLLMVGDGAQLEETRAILSAAELGSRVVFAGRVPPSEIPAYLDACDVLVSPHVALPDEIPFFGSPTKLFEYMASGRAIIASSLGQIADVLDHGRTAWLVPPGDVAALAQALRRLAGDRDLRKELGARARRTARTSHTWGRNVRCILDTYRAFVRDGR
jgi:glycosyltransferase involved in cell wall biosynthesis